MSGKKGMKGNKPHEESERYPEYYKKRFPELSDDECIAKAAWFRKSCMYQCIEYYEKRYPEATHEEHLRMLDEAKKSKKKFAVKREDIFQCIEYYEKRYPEATHEEHLRMLDEVKKAYIAKHPNIAGENNPSHKSKTTERQRKERSVMCIEYYEKHYPNLSNDERLSIMNKKIQEVMYKKSLVPQSTQLQYYIDKGMNKKEAKEALSERQRTFTLDKCISKYGEDEGTRIFEERQCKWQKSLHSAFRKNHDTINTSNISNNLIKEIREYCNVEAEFQLGRYSYDIRKNNNLIEFNRDYWHANPKIYDDTFTNSVSNLTAKEIHDKDAKKLDYAKANGYNILVIWESDYKEDPEGTVKKCIRFLND